MPTRIACRGDKFVKREVVDAVNVAGAQGNRSEPAGKRLGGWPLSSHATAAAN